MSLEKKSWLADYGGLMLKLFFIWLSWKVLYHIVGEESVPLEQRMFPALSAHWENLNDWLRIILLSCTEKLLHLLGYKTDFVDNYVVRVKGYGGIALGNYCLGFQLMYYFAMLVVISGFPILKKVIVATMGILLVQGLNIFRLTGLNIIDVHLHDWMFISHDYIFNIVVFGILLLFYYLMLRREVS